MRFSRRLRRYLAANWGAPFIIAFMLLLALAARELAFGFEASANRFAVYAYYLLVLGVVLQAASFAAARRAGARRRRWARRLRGLLAWRGAGRRLGRP